VKTYFGLIGIGLLAAVLAGGQLLWDGSYYLYKALDTQTPFVQNHRYIVVALQAPFLAAYHLTHDIAALNLVFGLTYALVPLLSLAVCWLIVRRTAPALFVWAALGFGFGTLMLQLLFIAEAVIAVQLMWPVMLATLTRPRWWTRLAAAGFAIAAFFTHPFALPLLAVAAVMAFVVALRFRSERREKLLWAGGFAVLTAAAVLRFANEKTNYETDQISLQILQTHFQQALKGWPIVGFAVVALACLFLFAAPYVQLVLARWQSPATQANLMKGLHLAEWASLVAAGALFAVWAIVPRYWASALAYRTWVLFFSLPFMGLAGLESLLSRADSGQGPQEQWRHRQRSVQVIGAVFAGVLVLQSLSWHNVTDQLKTAMAANAGPCISRTALKSVTQNALATWSVTPYSLLLQGSMPDKVVLDGDCAKTDFSKGLPIATWDIRKWTTGTFDFHLLEQSLVESS